MDVPRKDASRNRMIRRIIYAVIVICAIPLITMGYIRLKPAAPPVEKAPRSRASRASRPPPEPVVETELPLTNGDAPPSWTPEFDPGDDLNGLLDAKTRLLARAFRAAPPNERPDTPA